MEAVLMLYGTKLSVEANDFTGSLNWLAFRFHRVFSSFLSFFMMVIVYPFSCWSWLWFAVFEMLGFFFWSLGRERDFLHLLVGFLLEFFHVGGFVRDMNEMNWGIRSYGLGFDVRRDTSFCHFPFQTLLMNSSGDSGWVRWSSPMLVTKDTDILQWTELR